MLAALAAIVILVGCFLPWWQVGGGDSLPAMSENAFSGSGIVVVLAALGTIALVTLPYATDRPVGLDRALSYLILVALGWIGLVIRFAGLATVNVGAILPDRAPGIWLAALGLVVLSRAVYEIAREPERR
jgi:predicted membrane channel-forming protein YqfA (hemolysin III family)